MLSQALAKGKYGCDALSPIHASLLALVCIFPNLLLPNLIYEKGIHSFSSVFKAKMLGFTLQRLRLKRFLDSASEAETSSRDAAESCRLRRQFKVPRQDLPEVVC